MKNILMVIRFLAATRGNVFSYSPESPPRILQTKTTKTAKTRGRQSPTSSPVPTASLSPSASPKQECLLIDGGSEDCPVDFYCSTKPGCAANAGYCLKMNPICTVQFEPVCGCDGSTYSNDCFASSFGVNIAHNGACQSPSSSPTVKVSPGGMGEACDGSKPCQQGLKCYLPPIDSSYHQGMCGCETNDDCINSVYGTECIDAGYLERPSYLRAKLCAPCNPVGHTGCDQTSTKPFCDQGFGFVKCTCASNFDCPGEQNCGAPWCVPDFVRYCSVDHDAEWCDYGPD
jgi:hypothetical protein